MQNKINLSSDVVADYLIPSLGTCRIDSPIMSLLPDDIEDNIFINEDDRVFFSIDLKQAAKLIKDGAPLPSLEKSGPRKKIYFTPQNTTAAIVTCGGVCPGLNDVIRAIVMTLYYRYGVTDILGIRNGYEGFIEKYNTPPIKLTPDIVDHINQTGGTILGTSRGAQNTDDIVNFLEKYKIGPLFVIGGDGTMRGALSIADEAEKRKVKAAVIGIPKTVDNDILHIDRSFGFISAGSVAGEVVETLHNEAKSQRNGIGLVKLMGRHSGFIACSAALASGNANFVLIPEVPFELDGKDGFLKALEERILKRGHAVILVAEGAGQDIIPGEEGKKDASGNIRFKDIGIFIKYRINEYFKSRNIEVNLKYVDPSYIVRAVGAAPVDSIYCYKLGEDAVHAAMCGKTKAVIALRNNQFTHIPMALITQGRSRVDPEGDLWFSVLEATGQPSEFRNRK